MSARKLPPQGRPPSSAAEAAERLAAIVEAAERAASTVIDDAEEQARRRIEEAEERADRLVAERLRALADELDPPDGRRAEEPAAARPRSEAADAGEEAAPRLRPVESPDDGDGQSRRRPGSAGARLLATQMAVSGASREEIGERLRSGFEIEDAGEILDAILGPEE